MCMTEIEEGLQRLDRRVSARQGNHDWLAAGEFFNLRKNSLRVHRLPIMAVFGINRMQRIAPRAAVIAPARPHKHGRLADQCPFALDGGAEYFADTDHGLYSAQLRGVSDTRTADTSAQRALHQS